MDHVVRQGAKVARNTNNKRKSDNNSREKRMQQPPHKRQNMVRALTVGANDKKAYVGKLPYYKKCRLHHVGPCTVKCNNCKRVGHMTKRCRTFVPAITQWARVANQKPTVTCFECGAQGHFKSDCPKSKNQNRVNQIWNGKARENSNVVKDKTDA
ncbi:reverse transcriptase domain-containing protein [Tanacetum coccineum]